MRLLPLAERWNHRCAYCDRVIDPTLPHSHPHAPTCDHFIPRHRGGTRATLNCVYACKACNFEKGAIDPRRLLWVWLRVDPQGLTNAILVNMEPASVTDVLNHRKDLS